MSELASVRADVLVIGAGPVGMTAALLLAALDLDVVVVERKSGTSNEPKAISLDDESLRTYQSAGLAEEVLGVIVPGTGTKYFGTEGQTLFHARGTKPYRLGYPFKNPFAQPDLERVLHTALLSHPRVQTLYGTTLVDLAQDDSAVTATVAGATNAVIHASYAIGADGGRSVVREILDVAMVGRSHSEPWLVLDTLEDQRTERYALHIGDPDRPHVIVAGLEGRCRYEFLLFPGEGEPGDAVDFELIRALVSRYRTILPEQVERAVVYQFHSLVAQRWRVGRVFLAGDAAHMMPPFAGQGLNSGIRDAANLCWKLADVIEGRLAPAALETYQAERAPHAEKSVAFSARLGRIVMTTNPRLARRRDEVVARAMDTESGRQYLTEMRYRPTPFYSNGLVVGSQSSFLVGRLVGQPQVFDFRRHQVVRLDDVLGSRWSLVGVGVPSTAWDTVRDISASLSPTEVDLPLDDTFAGTRAHATTIIDVDGRLYEEFEPARGQFVLIRPDRYVAAAWKPEDSFCVAAAVSEWVRDNQQTVVAR